MARFSSTLLYVDGSPDARLVAISHVGLQLGDVLVHLEAIDLLHLCQVSVMSTKK